MESAALVGARHHRSAAEQIEFWAALGRQVARVLNPDSLLDGAPEQVIRNAALPLGLGGSREQDIGIPKQSLGRRARRVSLNGDWCVMGRQPAPGWGAAEGCKMF